MQPSDNGLTLIVIKPDMEERKLTRALLNKLKDNNLDIIYRGLV